jgi:hypothetical protein
MDYHQRLFLQHQTKRDTTMSDKAITIGHQEILGTKVPAQDRYGQNSATNPSSDLPGQHTHIEGFGKQVTLPKVSGGAQLRTVSADPIKPVHGQTRQTDPSILK